MTSDPIGASVQMRGEQGQTQSLLTSLLCQLAAVWLNALHQVAVTLQPTNLDQLTSELASANQRGEKIGGFDLRAFNRVVEHVPEDMTVTIEAGATVAALQTELAKRGQWLPIDPPRPERLSIGALLATNASGPRRFGYGMIREHLIGLRAVLPDGKVIKSGGKVVKNVAGYDVQKLFVGSYGCLGVIVEATFKLQPLPEAEQFVQARRDSLEKAGALIESVIDSETTPVVVDLHNRDAAGAATVVIGFAGRHEEVEWQLSKAREMGLSETGTLEHEGKFWGAGVAEPIRRWSVLPSRLVETIRGLGSASFVARAGNGVIHYRGGTEPPKSELPMKLIGRVKDAFDPKHILPELPL